MDELPTELVCMLGWYLTKRDAKSLGRTCKRFYSAMLKRIWNDVRIRGNYTKIDLRSLTLSLLPIRILRVQSFLWMESLTLEIHRFSMLQHFFFEHRIHDLQDIEAFNNYAFTVHISTKHLSRFINTDEFVSLLKRMKNVHLSIEANSFQFGIEDLQEIGGIIVERFDTGGICFCSALDDYRTALLQTLELLQPNKIDLRPLPLCCAGLLKFEAMDLMVLSTYPVQSFYIGLIKWQSPLVLHPPLQIIEKLFSIPTLKTIFTDYKLEYLTRMSELKKDVTIIKLW